MPHILLTGAGFSRNWGGWLANEALEYLLGSIHIDDMMRTRLCEAKERKLGFEDILAEAQASHESQRYGQPEEELRNLTNGIISMFADMAVGYAKTTFEPQNYVSMMVKTFLARFDAIYTLNQDTLLEQHYLKTIDGGRFHGAATPGVRPAGESSAISGHQIVLYTPDEKNFRLHGGIQPYYKLHGSFNWIYGNNLLLILGGNKEVNIKKQPILSWYHQRFQVDLANEDARLMIIGYSFNDAHINKMIGDAIGSGLKLFIIDPEGIDVIDKRNKTAATRESQSEFMKKVAPRVIGASRRPLTSTFNSDVVEFNKVMRFF